MNDPYRAVSSRCSRPRRMRFLSSRRHTGVIVAANAQAEADTGYSRSASRRAIERCAQAARRGVARTATLARHSWLKELARCDAKLTIGDGEAVPVRVSTIAFQLEGTECFS